MNNMIIVCIYDRFDNEDLNTKHVFNESKEIMFKDLAARIPYVV